MTHTPPSLAHPPADLAKRSLPTITLPPTLPAGRFYRLHRCRYNPLYFSSELARFTSPSLDFTACYMSTSALGAFGEAFLPSFPDDSGTLTPTVTGDFIAEHCLSEIALAAPLTLVALHSNRTASIGCSSLINNIGDYALTQEWAAALHAHPDQPDGLYYTSARAPEEHSIAVFDRAHSSLSVARTAPLSRDPDSITEALTRFGFHVLSRP